MGCTTSSLAAHINLVRDSSVPDKVIWGQLALFNSRMRTWIKRELVSLYIVAILPCILNCDEYSIYVIYKCLRFGTFDLQQDLGKPSRGSQAKPPAWEALKSIPSHMAGVNGKQYTLGQRLGWSHSQQCQQRISHSSMYESMITD